MTKTGRIVAYLQQYPGQGFCDLCLELRLRFDVETALLEDRNVFVREEGRCSNCARERIVTRLKA